MRSSQQNSAFGVYGIIFLIFIFCILMVIHQNANASHMLGAELSYKHVNGTKYQLQYTLYRDCSGIPAPADLNLKVESASLAYTSFHSLELVSGSETIIDQLCPSALTTCEGGTYPGMESLSYTCEVELPSLASDWIFSVSECCRNANITTINDPSSLPVYTEALLNNSFGPNNTAQFSSIPFNILFLGEQQYIHADAKDEDGDLLVYSLNSVKIAADQNVNYSGSYHKSNPFGCELNLDASSGRISLKPENMLTGVYVVSVEEYRNGILISRISRDMQMSVVAPNNSAPELSGINGGSDYEIKVCKGEPFAFDIFSADADQQQSLNISWDHSIPGAQITTGSGLHPVSRFSWNPSDEFNTESTYRFSMTVSDDACPYVTSRTYHYTIHFSELDLSVSVTPQSCPGMNDGKIMTSILGTEMPYQLNWSDVASDQMIRENLPAGNYEITVKDASGCELKKQVEIETLHASPVLYLGGSLAACNGHELLLEAGSIENNYTWSDGSTASSLSVSEPGVYSVTVINPNGCSVTSEVKVIFQECNGMERSENGSETIQVYPNPATDKLNFDLLNFKEEKITLQIINMQGQLLAEHKLDPETYGSYSADISMLGSGIYLVTIQGMSELHSVRFVKK